MGPGGGSSFDVELDRFEAMDLFPLGKDVSGIIDVGGVGYKANGLRVELGLVTEKQSANGSYGVRPVVQHSSSPLTLRAGIDSIKGDNGGASSTGVGVTLGLPGQRQHQPQCELLQQQVVGDGWPCWALSNHDCERSATRWGGPSPDLRQLRLMAAFQASLRGTVCLYQGEELGLPAGWTDAALLAGSGLTGAHQVEGGMPHFEPWSGLHLQA